MYSLFPNETVSPRAYSEQIVVTCTGICWGGAVPAFAPRGIVLSWRCKSGEPSTNLPLSVYYRLIDSIDRFVHCISRFINGINRLINCIHRLTHIIILLVNGWTLGLGPGQAPWGWVGGFKSYSENPGIKFRCFFWFYGLLMYFLEVLIVPKWLINDSGHTPFGTSKNVSQSRPACPLFITEIL